MHACDCAIDGRKLDIRVHCQFNENICAGAQSGTRGKTDADPIHTTDTIHTDTHTHIYDRAGKK